MTTKKLKIKTLLREGDIQVISDLMGGLLDKQSAVLASKEDLQKVELRLGSVEVNMATKQDLADLKSYMHEGFESVIAGVDAISEKLTEKEKFDRLVEWAREVGEKVGVKSKV